VWPNCAGIIHDERFRSARRLAEVLVGRPIEVSATIDYLLQDSRLDRLAASLSALGYHVYDDQPLEGFSRIYVDDPFGNRIELMEPLLSDRAS